MIPPSGAVVPGGVPFVWNETQESQDEPVVSNPVTAVQKWGGHPLVRTTKHGDPDHKTPPGSPDGGAADDSMVTDKSGSGSPIGGPAAGADQPYTQPEDESEDEIPDEIPETPTPAKGGTLRGVGQNARKRTCDEESVDERISPPPKQGKMDTAKVLGDVSAKLQGIADKKASTARLLAIEKARIEAIIGDSHWPAETINEMDLRDGLKHRRFKDLVEFAENAVDELEKSAAREQELRAAQERIRQLEAQIQADPPPVSPAVRGVQERIRQLEAQIQAGPQQVSPAARGVGYSPVSPAAGGAGCQPVFLDGQNWMMPPFPYCRCTDRPKRPYVPRRIRKKGPNEGMVMGACANWKYGENEYKGCGWYGDPFPWPRDLSPK